MDAPRILFYSANIAPQSQRGVARYCYELATVLATEHGSRLIVFGRQSLCSGRTRCIPSLPIGFRGSGRLRIKALNERIGKWLAERNSVKCFFSPYYGNVRTRIPQLYTVHDMIHELRPDVFDPLNPSIRDFVDEKRRCLERAAALIAVSQNTARDIRRVYPYISAEKIHVVPHGVNADFFGRDPWTPESRPRIRPYFLYVGHRDGYKNFLRLLEAFGRSGLADDIDLRVISPVGRSWSDAEQVQLKRWDVESCVHLMAATTDVELRYWYSRALAFVYSSEIEGFGLPILEAMASGTLVACSNTSSMPEVGGDVAFYFDPFNVDEIAACLHQMVNLPASERLNRVSLGRARARTFTWEKCGQETAAVLRQLL